MTTRNTMPTVPPPPGYKYAQVWDDKADQGNGGYVWTLVPDREFIAPKAPADPAAAANAAADNARADAALAAQLARDAAAQAHAERRLALDAEIAAANKEERALDREERKAKDAADRAERAGDKAEAAKWRLKEFEYREKRDAILDHRADLELESRALDRQLDADKALGYINGKPTINQQQLDLQKQKQAAELANQPGNVYNYNSRAWGQEPPSLPATPGLAAAGAGPAPGSSTAATRDISQWKNMTIPQLLATFSAVELARLPMEAVVQLPNEAKIAIAKEYPGGPLAFWKLLPESVKATFGQDDIQKYFTEAAPPTPEPLETEPIGRAPMSPAVAAPIVAQATGRPWYMEMDDAALMAKLEADPTLRNQLPDSIILRFPNEWFIKNPKFRNILPKDRAATLPPEIPETPKAAPPPTPPWQFAPGKGFMVPAAAPPVQPAAPPAPGVIQSSVNTPGQNWMAPSTPGVQPPRQPTPEELATLQQLAGVR